MSADILRLDPRVLAHGPSQATLFRADHGVSHRDFEFAVRYDALRVLLDHAARLEDRNTRNVQRDQAERERTEVTRGRTRAHFHAATSLREYAASARKRARGTREGLGRARA